MRKALSLQGVRLVCLAALFALAGVTAAIAIPAAGAPQIATERPDLLEARVTQQDFTGDAGAQSRILACFDEQIQTTRANGDALAEGDFFVVGANSNREMTPDDVFRDEVEGGGQCVRMVFTDAAQALRAWRVDRRGRSGCGAREHRRPRKPRRRRAPGGLGHAPRRRRHRGAEPDPRPGRPDRRHDHLLLRQGGPGPRGRRRVPLPGDQLERAGRGHAAAARRARPCAATFANVTPDAERFIVDDALRARRRASPFDDPNSGQVAGANGVPAPPSSVPELLEARKVANTRGTFDLRYNVPVEVDDIDRCEAFLEDGSRARGAGQPGASEREHDPRGLRHRRRHPRHPAALGGQDRAHRGRRRRSTASTRVRASRRRPRSGRPTRRCRRSATRCSRRALPTRRISRAAS